MARRYTQRELMDFACRQGATSAQLARIRGLAGEGWSVFAVSDQGPVVYLSRAKAQRSNVATGNDHMKVDSAGRALPYTPR